MRDLGIADRIRTKAVAHNIPLTVIEVAGWQTRGVDAFDPRGSVDHHTAGARSGLAPSLGICINGRADLPGPLCHVLVGRPDSQGNMTAYIIASGRANHAGDGGWAGLTGNRTVYGVERENVGTPAEPWTLGQTVSAALIHAALIEGRAGADKVCRHQEWAPTRKIDTHTLQGAQLRQLVQHFLAPVATPPPPPQIPFPPQEGSAMFQLISDANAVNLFVPGQRAVRLSGNAGAHKALKVVAPVLPTVTSDEFERFTKAWDTSIV